VACVPDAKPTVFVVDDDISIRESLELLISYAGWDPETYSSAQEFLDRPQLVAPSCLILDINLPGLSGLELQKIVASDRWHMPIIFITGYGDVPMSVQAMKAGAIEFLTKPFTEVSLLDAIQHAVDRSRSMCKREAEMQLLRKSYASLTPRERDVMALVVTGLLNKQVGSELEISEITVKAHRARVMQKMSAGSLPDLVKMAASLELVAKRKPQTP
jgi:FixJ family two-component response regulator